MSLSVVATPIGNPQDISLRAIEAMKQADLIIGEERKVTALILKTHQIGQKKIELLNEHSDAEDLRFLLSQCESLNVALVSDCGTPGFCDPGADLVQACRKKNIEVITIPGASSLMVFLSGCGLKLEQFYFYGFIPGKPELRKTSFNQLKNISVPTIIMDTPYRLQKLLSELHQFFPNTQCIMGLSLTMPEETFLYGTPSFLQKKIDVKKAEFVLMLLPKKGKK